MATTLSVTKKQSLALTKEIALGHHIPNVLINKIARLKNVRYRTELKDFAQLYKKTKFNDITDEYEIVKEFINKLLRKFLPTTISHIIEREMRASLAGQILDTQVRETFIHPFQVFLIGSVIIDRFDSHFNTWYDPSLNGNVNSSIEASWLLASILHDCGKTRNILRKELEYVGGGAVKFQSEDEYIRLLSSFYTHISSEKTASSWTQQSPNNTVLENILSDYSQRWSHGIKGAIIMLNNICNAPANVTPRDIIAGFSIMIHDKETWQALKDNHFLPLRMDLFPLACLLLQLDAAQEWGRQRIVDTDSRLVGISIKQQTVTIEISFDSIKALEDKDTECNLALDCVDSNQLEISLDMRIKKRLSR